MSLAFALAAAINGSTGSRATLSFGLFRDQASPASVRRQHDSHRSGVAAQAARDTVLKLRACWWQDVRNGSTLSRSTRSQPPPRMGQRPKGSGWPCPRTSIVSFLRGGR